MWSITALKNIDQLNGGQIIIDFDYDMISSLSINNKKLENHGLWNLLSPNRKIDGK